MSAIERYARVSRAFGDREGTFGLELRSDDVTYLNEEMHATLTAAMICRGDHLGVATWIETWCAEHYPGRAFFVEHEVDGCGVQIYQPYGMPRHS